MSRSTILAVVTMLVGSLLPLQRAGAQMVHFVDNTRGCEGRTPCYSTITDAVAAAAPFDTIAVFPGVYHETVAFEGPSKGDITLRSHGRVKPVIAPSAGNGVSILAAPRVQVLNFVIEAPSTAVSIGGPLSSGYVIQFEGAQRPEDNLIRRNLVRRGGIDLNAPASGNTIVANFVSGSPGDGISIGVLNHGSVNVIERNTSVENAGCDVNDRSDGGNTWTNNRFGTSCGAASAQASATPARGSARATPAESSLTPEDED